MYYKSNTPTNSAVIVLPKRGTFGYNAAQLIAAYLAVNGIRAYLLETPFHGPRRVKRLKGGMPTELEQLQIAFRQGISEAMALTDLVEEEHVGICGVSLGAIYASIVYAHHDKLKGACLVGGGGNIAGMMIESQDGFFKYLREQHVKGITKEMLESEFSEVEPCNHVKSEKAANLLMIIASRDKYVPSQYGEQLRAAWGNPQRILAPPGKLKYLLPAGHYSVLIYAPWLLPKILKHFKRTLF